MSNKKHFSSTGTLVNGTGASQFYSKNKMIEVTSSQLGNRKKTNLQENSKKVKKKFESIHFHYDSVTINELKLSVICDEFTKGNFDKTLTSSTSLDFSADMNFFLLVLCGNHGWTIMRSLESLVAIDNLLHKCIFDRSVSHLLPLTSFLNCDTTTLFAQVKTYMQELTLFLSLDNVNLITCVPVLDWLELDCKGRRYTSVNRASSVNIPASFAVQAIKSYCASEPDELSFEVGELISVIDKANPGESDWWRGKKDCKVGYFPSEYVEVIGNKNIFTHKPQHHNSKPVLNKKGKFAALLLSFLTSRPNRQELRRDGIVKERLFGCDLAEHLCFSSLQVPTIVTKCIEFIEEKVVIDGVYRLSALASNLQKLRYDFDTDNQADIQIGNSTSDLHSVPCLLKMYFRELPNPLLTNQLSPRFLEACNIEDETSRLHCFRRIISFLPPPHFRTAKALFEHLQRMSNHDDVTNMDSHNLSIVWAPNLIPQFLQTTTSKTSGTIWKIASSHALLIQHLILHASSLFSHSEDSLLRPIRPKSIKPIHKHSNQSSKLISLKEAQQLYGGKGVLEGKKKEEGEDEYFKKLSQVHSVLQLPNKGEKKSRKTETLGMVKDFKSFQDLSVLQHKPPRPLCRSFDDEPSDDEEDEDEINKKKLQNKKNVNRSGGWLKYGADETGEDKRFSAKIKVSDVAADKITSKANLNDMEEMKRNRFFNNIKAFLYKPTQSFDLGLSSKFHLQTSDSPREFFHSIHPTASDNERKSVTGQKETFVRPYNNNTNNNENTNNNNTNINSTTHQPHYHIFKDDGLNNDDDGEFTKNNNSDLDDDAFMPVLLTTNKSLPPPLPPKPRNSLITSDAASSPLLDTSGANDDKPYISPRMGESLSIHKSEEDIYQNTFKLKNNDGVLKNPLVVKRRKNFMTDQSQWSKNDIMEELLNWRKAFDRRTITPSTEEQQLSQQLTTFGKATAKTAPKLKSDLDDNKKTIINETKPSRDLKSVAQHEKLINMQQKINLFNKFNITNIPNSASAVQPFNPSANFRGTFNVNINDNNDNFDENIYYNSIDNMTKSSTMSVMKNCDPDMPQSERMYFSCTYNTPKPADTATKQQYSTLNKSLNLLHTEPKLLPKPQIKTDSTIAPQNVTRPPKVPPKKPSTKDSSFRNTLLAQSSTQPSLPNEDLNSEDNPQHIKRSHSLHNNKSTTYVTLIDINPAQSSPTDQFQSM